MNRILEQLKTINLEAILYPANDVIVTTPEQVKVLKKILDYLTQYLDNRPHQLASITKALQVALEDEVIGLFEKSDVINLVHFMGDEFKAIAEVNFIKDTITFHLTQYNACKDGGKK